MRTNLPSVSIVGTTDRSPTKGKNMRLKSLELHGFKSFPDRTKINFSEGMTVIVGPNGSGKSNISDAIRWVLGDLSAKNIRGNKMEDVIFGGTDGRSPMSFAEVSLTIENTGENRIENDFEEIKITRRYYRSGDSEYLINNKVSRLRDITEMFMNTGIGKTGYSIVGQGRVSEIISQKSEERRLIFEEAAGISKYRFKKQEAERRLADTDENLVRVTDIASELEGRIGPLEKDAAKAKVYLDLYEKKKAADIAIAVFDMEKINSSSKVIEDDYRASERELEISDDAIASYDTRIERLGEMLNESKADRDRLSREAGELGNEAHAIDGELLVMKNELSHLEFSLETSQKTLDGLRNTIESKKADAKSAEENHKNASDKYADAEKRYADATEKLSLSRERLASIYDRISTLDTQMSETVRLHTDARIALSALDETKSTIEGRKAEISAEMSSTDSAIVQTRSEIGAVERTLEKYKAKLDEIEARRAELASLRGKQADMLEGLQREYNTLLAQISSMDQRALTLKRMEEHFEGYSKSVKFIADASASGRLFGICGPVSQIIQVDRKYSVAIETALGANIQNIIVENEQAAKSAIALLKRENAGRSTFYPITSMRPSRLNLQSFVEKSQGFIGIASDIVKFDSKYYPVISSILGKTLIFDNLENASATAKQSGYTLRIVTLDGQIINAGGSFTGGSAKRDSGILTRTVEIDEILDAKKKAEEKAASIKKKIDDATNSSGDCDDENDRLSNDFALFSALYRSEQTALSFKRSKLDEEKEKKSSLDESLKGLILQESEKEGKRAKIRDDCEAYIKTEGEIQEMLDVANLEKNNAESETNNLISEKNEALTAVSVCKKELEMAGERYDRLKAEVEALGEEETKTEDAISLAIGRTYEIMDKIRSSEDILADYNKRLADAKEGESSLGEKSLELEKEINDLRRKSKELSRERENTFMRYTTLKSKFESISTEKTKITDRLWEDYDLTYADAQNAAFEPVTEETRGKRVSEQAKLRSKIRELGNVNVDAIEEYTKVKERFEFLSTQINDLNKSKKEFTDIISKLEVEMCRKFSETFEKVNENFKEVFAELFGGGSGSLTLTDPENVLTSGIEINVAPPGKIIKNLKLLSGGEQVFVAIGIFFAILKVNPSPFCLLDEIESALDEVNVDRFASYARNYSDNTQFIIITHRRGTMEEADTLYGVTMQERGISKILSINVSEVEQKLGVKL